MTDQDLHALLQRQIYTGPDGSERILIRPFEGEFVCAACDTIQVATSRPARCSACLSERIETLTDFQGHSVGAVALGGASDHGDGG